MRFPFAAYALMIRGKAPGSVATSAKDAYPPVGQVTGEVSCVEPPAVSTVTRETSGRTKTAMLAARTVVAVPDCDEKTASGPWSKSTAGNMNDE
jgi:hypothetical protein